MRRDFISPVLIPNELLSEVVNLLPKADLPRLATTSRQFHAVTTRLIYQRVNLARVADIEACIRALAFNESLAGHVRELDIWVPSARPYVIHSSR